MYFGCWEWFYFTVDIPDIFIQVDKSLQPNLKMLGAKVHLSIDFGEIMNLELNREKKQRGFTQSKFWPPSTEFLFTETENLWIQAWCSKYVGLFMWAQFRTAQLGPWILIKQSLLSPSISLPTLIQIDMASNVSQQKEQGNGHELLWGSLSWHLNRAKTLMQALTMQVRMCGCTRQPVVGSLHHWHSLHPLPPITTTPLQKPAAHQIWKVLSLLPN